MTLADYRACLAIARRHARSAADAADLLHEALLAAARTGRVEFRGEAERAWLAGTIRNIAREHARSAIRRRRRETRWAAEQPTDTGPEAPPGPGELLERLTEGARRVAVLAIHGLNADEVQYVLGLKPAAFRQRLTALRRALGVLPDALRAEAMALAYSRPRRAGENRLDFGLIRRALLHRVRGGQSIGTHDPDGHLLEIEFRP
ncbi:MAG TPA: sigma factor [Steroidobacteraceae bacterium]|nr:sigma factor [Steroidobacteraceae bacterium]